MVAVRGADGAQHLIDATLAPSLATSLDRDAIVSRWDGVAIVVDAAAASSGRISVPAFAMGAVAISVILGWWVAGSRTN